MEERGLKIKGKKRNESPAWQASDRIQSSCWLDKCLNGLSSYSHWQNKNQKLILLPWHLTIRFLKEYHWFEAIQVKKLRLQTLDKCIMLIDTEFNLSKLFSIFLFYQLKAVTKRSRSRMREPMCKCQESTPQELLIRLISLMQLIFSYLHSRSAHWMLLFRKCIYVLIIPTKRLPISHYPTGSDITECALIQRDERDVMHTHAYRIAATHFIRRPGLLMRRNIACIVRKFGEVSDTEVCYAH